MPALPLNPSLGKPVTSRQFSWKEMVIRQWGSQYAAPDYGVYVWSNGRSFDSTDLGQTGIYRRPGTGPVFNPYLTADNSLVTADSSLYTADY